MGKKKRDTYQIDLFADSPDNFKITKKIRLIESFAGIGFQRLGIQKVFPDMESWKIMEWAVPSIIGYDSVHNGKKENYAALPKKELVEKLYKLGISVDYNNPATLKQIEHLSESKLNDIYYAIQRTNNLVNIMNVKGKDLELNKCKDYTTIWTYSFPCQDLSLAGDKKGMSVSQSEEEGTRSGLVWEIIRILKECKELGDMPTCLLMENVIQVHSDNNKEEWNKLLKELYDLGYQNFWKDMIGNEYGIPQTRNRTFMLSIYDPTHTINYSFPEPEKLKIFLKDMLEENVDEKYYLSEKLINCFLADGSEKYPRKERFIQNVSKDNQEVCNTITTLNGQRATDQFIVEGDISNQALRETLEKVKPTETTLLDCYNKSGRTDVANTLTTRTSESNNTFLVEKQEIPLKRGYSISIKEENKEIKEEVIGQYDYTKSKTFRPTEEDRVPKETESSSTILASGNHPALIVKCANSKGYAVAEDGDGVDISSRMEYHRGTVQKGMIQTLKCGLDVGVVVKEDSYSELEKQLFTEDGNIRRYLGSEEIDEFKEGQMATTTYPNGYGHGPRTHDESIALNTVDRPSVKVNLRIRKLTALECIRLMGADDYVYYNLRDYGGLSESQIIHCAGDELIVQIPQKIVERMK